MSRTNINATNSSYVAALSTLISGVVEGLGRFRGFQGICSFCACGASVQSRGEGAEFYVVFNTYL